jgi:hypothetical protein
MTARDTATCEIVGGHGPPLQSKAALLMDWSQRHLIDPGCSCNQVVEPQ